MNGSCSHDFSQRRLCNLTALVLKQGLYVFGIDAVEQICFRIFRFAPTRLCLRYSLFLGQGLHALLARQKLNFLALEF